MNQAVFSRRVIAIALPAFLLSAMVGCDAGPAMGTVTGRVLFEGKPYSAAAVVFFSTTTGGGSTSNLASDGTFSLPTGLPVGKYRVYLAPALSDSVAGDAPPPGVKTDASIPDRYWSESSTDIVVDVEAGENQFTIEMNR